MPKVLVAVDIAKDGQDSPAIDIARKLAPSFGADIALLYVLGRMPDYMLAELPKRLLEDRKKAAKNTLKDLVAKHKLPPDTGFDIREGHPATEILDHAKSIEADLIVMSAHDPGLPTFLLGSVSARVVRRAHCSVHVVR